jgi:hypothetical protein
MLKNTLQKNYKIFLSKDNLIMNINIMPKLYNKDFSLSKQKVKS